MSAGTQPNYPVFRGPLLTVLILSLIILITHWCVESVLGGSVMGSPGPGKLWAHGKIVEVSMEAWERLRLLDRVADAAFVVFIASLFAVGVAAVARPAWYMRTKSWMWVNISLVVGALLTGLVVLLVRSWPAA